MQQKKSVHILNTSANLLGFCLIVITSLHLGNKTESSYSDESASLSALLLVSSTLFSYISIKTKSEQLSSRLEIIADTLFIISLLGIIGIVVFLFISTSSKI